MDLLKVNAVSSTYPHKTMRKIFEKKMTIWLVCPIQSRLIPPAQVNESTASQPNERVCLCVREAHQDIWHTANNIH